MGWLSDAWDATTDFASGAVDTVGGVVSDAGAVVGDAAVGLYHAGVSAADTASDYIHRGEAGLMDGIHWVEDGVDSGTHALANMVSDVPILGTLAEGAADAVTFGTQFTGGVIGGASTLVGGVANAALHPIDTAVGLETMAEHIPGPLGQSLRLGHNLLNVATGDESFGEAMDRSFNPMTAMQEDGRYWGNVGSALWHPYQQAIDEGRYGEVAGRGAFDIGMLLSGVGEAEAAGTAGRVGEAAEAARAAEAAEAARAAEAAEAARAAEAAEAAR
ncbi:MAG: hypothetical protein K8W52_21375, partial [Deltaproteobacteria bacterium]|nr:hypothetical protein [Deltaproteobacteria bacterium]